MASYRDLQPLETGGEIARRGFDFQDHVAVSYCIEMLDKTTLVEIWCETHDDVTLVWNVGGTETFEFVQAKSNLLDQLWSITLLCKRPPGKTKSKRGDSIVHKSLAHDRGDEPCRFRIATALGFQRELQALTYEPGAPGRCDSALCAKLAPKFQRSMRAKSALTSPNGNDLTYWLERLVLQDMGSIDALTARNRLRLQERCAALGIDLAGKRLEIVYERLVAMVFDAGSAQWNIDPDEKRIDRHDLVQFLKDEAHRAGLPPMTAGKKLKTKITAAKMDQTYVDAALSLRRKYRSRALDVGYVDRPERDVEDAAYAALHRLRTQLLANPSIKDGPTFVQQCCDELRAIATKDGVVDRILEAYLLGYMYEVTDRCEHKFTR